MNKLLKSSIITAALMMFASVTSAAELCSVNDPNADGMKTSDVTYNGNNSDDCYGVILGNDNVAGTINTELAALWDGNTDSWDFLAKDDAPGVTGTGSFNGINFGLTANAGTSGDWTLTGTDTNIPTILPTYLDFIVVLKSSDRFGAWLLDDVKFDGNDSGTWTINFLNKGGNIPDLSHLSLYVRDGERPPTETPEPAVLGLIAFGLLGLAFIRRRN